jgi:uncharacterized membrane protein
MYVSKPAAVTSHGICSTPWSSFSDVAGSTQTINAAVLWIPVFMLITVSLFPRD